MTVEEIVLPGVGNDYLNPDILIDVQMGQGPANAAVDARQILVAMPFLSTGTAVTNTLYDVSNDTDVRALVGAKSPARRALALIFALAPAARVKYLAIPETTGGAPLAADCDITITVAATNPTGTGFVRGWLGDVVACYYTFTTADTATTIAAGCVAWGNTIDDLPVTMANVAGVITQTAALKGISQGDATSIAHRVRWECTPGLGVTVPTEAAGLGMSPAQAGVDGTTTGAAQLATALATVTNVGSYYKVINGWDATSLTNLRTHLANQALPISGLRCVGIAGFSGALAAGISLAVAKNHVRIRLAQQIQSEKEPALLAAAYAAVLFNKEMIQNNLNKYRGPDWTIPKVFAYSDRPTKTDMNDAIKGGVTLIGSDDAGSYINKSVSTRSKDAGGTINDFRALETHRLSRMDEFAEVVDQTIRLQYGTMDFEDDEFLADGVTVNPNQTFARNVCKPSQIKRTMIDLIESFNNPGNRRFTAIDKTIAALVVNKHPSMSGVAQIRCPASVVDIFNQARAALQEVGGR